MNRATKGGRPPSEKSAATRASANPPKPGPKPLAIVEFPESVTNVWDDPASFAEALDMHMRRHGDTVWRLHRAIGGNKTIDRATLATWRRGAKAPRTLISLRVLDLLECRYRLPTGYFKAKLANPARSPYGFNLPGIPNAERRRLVWHLPDDFDQRPLPERNSRRRCASSSTSRRRR